MSSNVAKNCRKAEERLPSRHTRMLGNAENDEVPGFFRRPPPLEILAPRGAGHKYQPHHQPFPSTRAYSFHLHLYPMNLATPSFSSIKSGSGGRSGGGDGFLFVNPSKRFFAKSKILCFSMIFYELIPGFFWSSCLIFVPSLVPQTPKQRGILTDGVGYE